MYIVKRLPKLGQLDWSTSTEVATEQVAASIRTRAKRRKVGQHEEQIKRLTDEFRDGDSLRWSLLNSMSRVVLLQIIMVTIVLCIVFHFLKAIINCCWHLLYIELI